MIMVLLTIFQLMLMFAVAASALIATAWMHDKAESLWRAFRRQRNAKTASLTVLPPFLSSEESIATPLVSEKVITLKAHAKDEPIHVHKAA